MTEKDDPVARQQQIADMLSNPDKLQEYFSEGKTFQELLGFSNDQMEQFYQGAYRIFEQKRWDDAADAFLFLTTLNPYVHTFWLGLGMAEQSKQEYEQALTAYSMAAMTDPESPVPHIHSCECHDMLKDIDKSIEAVEQAIKNSEGKDDFQDLHQHALGVKRSLEAEKSRRK